MKLCHGRQDRGARGTARHHGIPHRVPGRLDAGNAIDNSGAADTGVCLLDAPAALKTAVDNLGTADTAYRSSCGTAWHDVVW